MKEDKELGPVVELIAGCPFTNFAKCKGAKYAFFVKTFANDPESARECIIRSIFFHQMYSNIILLLERGSHTVTSRALSLGQLYSQRIAELIGDCLRKLDGLLVPPKTAESLKDNISVSKLEILEQLKIFAGP